MASSTFSNENEHVDSLIQLDANARYQFESIFKAATERYKEDTGRDILELVQKRTTPETKSIDELFYDEEARFKHGREKHQKARNILKSCVGPIEALSDVAKSALSLTPFAPAATIFGAGMFLLGACENVTRAYDCVAQLFEECQKFTVRLKVFAQTQLDNYFFQKLTYTLRFLLEVFAECEKIVSSRRAKIYWVNMFVGKNEILSGKVAELNKHFEQDDRIATAQIFVTGTETRTKLDGLLASWNKERASAEGEKLQKNITSLSLGPVDIATKLREECRKCIHSRPDWILRTEAFQHWESETSSGPAWLWGVGNAGAGKTSLVSFLADSWHEQAGPMETSSMKKFNAHADSKGSEQAPLPYSAVALFYCSYKSIGRQGPDTIFRSLVRQLLMRLHEVHPARAEERVRQIEPLQSPRSVKKAAASSWTSVLDDVIGEFTRAYVIIDALDESDDEYEELLQRLSLLSSPSLRLFVTSRDERAMPSDLPVARKTLLTIRATDEFIQSYVATRLSRIRARDGSSEPMGSSALPQALLDDETLTPRIVEKVVKTAKGNFQHAELLITSLKAEKDAKDVASRLDTLAENSLLSEVIHEAIKRIEGQTNHDAKQIGMKALMWATYAGSTLTVEELRHALALTIRPHAREDQKAHAIEVARIKQSVIVEATRFFLRIDTGGEKEKNTVQVHKAIKDYCDHANIFEDAHYQMAEVCLTFLDQNYFSLKSNDKEEFHRRRKQIPFYRYAARNWGLHVKKAGEKKFLEPASPVSMSTLLHRKLFLNCVAAALHEDLQSVRMWNWHFHDTWKHVRESPEPAVPATHLLVWFDLPQTLDWWLRQQASVAGPRSPPVAERCSPTGTTPLYLACHLGRVRIVESLLFDFHANPVHKGAQPHGHNLAAAVIAQSTGAIERLLYVNKNDLVRQRNWHDLYPLSEAAKRENVENVQMIVDAIETLPDGKEVLVHAEQNDGWTALHEAARSPQASAEIVQILINAKGGKAFLNKRTQRLKDTALHIAAQEGNTSVVEKLLELGADPTAGQEVGKTPLHYAVEGVHERNSEVIEVLLKHPKVNHDAQDIGGFTHWHLAAIFGRSRNLGLLIKKSSRSLANVKDVGGLTPIRVAIDRRRGDWTGCVDRLLRLCPGELTSEDAFPVFNALLREHDPSAQKALERLLRNPVHPMPLHPGKTTVLHRIIDEGTLDVVKIAYECFPSPEVLEYRDAGNSTALLLAVKIGASEKACFLLEKGAQPNAQDDTGRTALHHAVEGDMAGLAAMLLDRHADYHIKDNSGVSALERASAQNACRGLWQFRNAIRVPSHHHHGAKNQHMCVHSERTWTIHVVGEEAHRKRLLEQRDRDKGSTSVTPDTISIHRTDYLVTEPIPPTAKLPLLRVNLAISWRTNDTRDTGDVWHDICILRNGRVERQHMLLGFVEGRHNLAPNIGRGNGGEDAEAPLLTHTGEWHLERGLVLDDVDINAGPASSNNDISDTTGGAADPQDEQTRRKRVDLEKMYGPRADKQARIRGFVRALRVGDQIVIVPMAAFGASHNTVERAEVSVWYEA